MPHQLGAIRFKHPDRAQNYLARIERALGPKLMRPLRALLAQSPDPDSVLNLLDRYAEVAPPDVLRELGRRAGALSYLAAAFGFGGLLSDAVLAEPELVVQFARDRDFTAPKSPEDLLEDYARFSATESAADLGQRLAHFKRRNYVRIALKDVLGLATLAETTLELSALADVILTEALSDIDRRMQKRFGQPQYRDAQGRLARSGFSIISLGKLGGNELNYSSDIDLLFLYARDGETAGGTRPDSVISNKEYFVRLAQALTHELAEPTSQGQLFRVDLRLRPEGDQGDLTLTLNAALDYYGHRARDWELQMLIKARHSAGDARLTRAFLRGMEPYIYSSPADPGAVESVRMSRARLTQHLRAGHPETLDVKLHPGGIRDIEFLTQCLQRLYGAREHWVRSGGTLHALRKLNDKELLPDRDYASLTSAYEFLRRVEHRIQLDGGRQSHQLPRDPDALELLARRVGVEATAEGTPGVAIENVLAEIMSRVGEVFRRLIPSLGSESATAGFELKPAISATDLHRLSWISLLHLLEVRAPELARMVHDANLPSRARVRLARFLAVLIASARALTTAREHPRALERALEALRVSEYLSLQLVRDPAILAELDVHADRLSPHAQLAMQLDAMDPVPITEGGPGAHARSRPAAPWTWAAEESLALREKITLLRQSFRARTLALGVGDCAEPDDVFARLDRWSDLAAAAVASAFAMARWGLPRGTSGAFGPADTPLAVLALGRLGLSEFDLGSDADLIFVAPSGTSLDGLARAIRWAEKTIEALASYTHEGVVFAVDTRLRPRGLEGELVTTEQALFDYLAACSEPWEALTYLKACPVAGDAELCRRTVSGAAERIFARFADDGELASALCEMRQRLEKEVKGRTAPTKTAAGGYYDVDFAVSYLRLRHRLGALPGSNMVEQLEILSAAGVMTESDARTLAGGATFLRAVDHAVRLVTGRASRGWRDRPGQAEGVEHLLRLWRFASHGQSLLEQLQDVQQQVREVFNRVLGAG